VTEITLWHGVNPPANRDVLDELVAQFNASHPDIQVRAFYVGQEDQQPPKILSAVVGNVPPDLLWYTPTLTGRLVELEAILPLENWLRDRHFLEQIDPALLDTMRWEGHLWSIPFGTNNVGIFYRPSLFQAAGIQDLPQSWAEFRALARQLTGSWGKTRRHGILLPLGKGEWTVFMWLPFLWSAGGDLLTPAGQVDLVTPEAIAALQFWQDLVRDGSAVLSQPERGYELTQFLAGRVAMQLTGPWTLRQLNATGVDYGVIPIPGNPEPATSLGGENLFVFKTTPRRQQAALEFAAWVLSEEFQTTWALGTGYLPVNLQSRQSQEYQAFVQAHPVLEVFLEQATVGRSRPILPDYSRLSDALGRAIEAVLLGKSDPRTALQDAQSRLEMLKLNAM
jgi:multiple sugar transport system substrate-binding protein